MKNLSVSDDARSTGNDGDQCPRGQAGLDLPWPRGGAAVRAFNPPGAWFEANGERVRVLEAAMADGVGAPGEIIDGELTIACGSGAIQPIVVQRAGRSVMSADELLRGYAIPPGTRL